MLNMAFLRDPLAMILKLSKWSGYDCQLLLPPKQICGY